MDTKKLTIVRCEDGILRPCVDGAPLAGVRGVNVASNEADGTSMVVLVLETGAVDFTSVDPSPEGTRH